MNYNQINNTKESNNNQKISYTRLSVTYNPTAPNPNTAIKEISKKLTPYLITLTPFRMMICVLHLSTVNINPNTSRDKSIFSRKKIGNKFNSPFINDSDRTLLIFDPLGKFMINIKTGSILTYD